MIPVVICQYRDEDRITMKKGLKSRKTDDRASTMGFYRRVKFFFMFLIFVVGVNEPPFYPGSPRDKPVCAERSKKKDFMIGTNTRILSIFPG